MRDFSKSKSVISHRFPGGEWIPLEDLVPGASLSLGFRQMRSDYAGDPVNVEESAGSTNQDIGFLGDEAKGTIFLPTDFHQQDYVDFIAPGTGRLRQFKDQSVNAHVLAQSVSANQPDIALDLLGPQPGGVWNSGATDFLSETTPDFMIGATGFTAYAVVGYEDLAFQNIFTSSDTLTNDQYVVLGMSEVGGVDFIKLQMRYGPGGINDIVYGHTDLSAVGGVTVLKFESDGTSNYNLEVNGVAQNLSFLAGGNNGKGFEDVLGRKNIVLGSLNRLSGNQKTEMNMSLLAMWPFKFNTAQSKLIDNQLLNF